MRKVHIGGQAWEFQTGKGCAVIRDPRTGKKTCFLPSFHRALAAHGAT
jgi:hypothetical protein